MYSIMGRNTVHLCNFDLISEALRKVEVSSRIPFGKLANVNKVFKDVFIHGYHGITIADGPEWKEQRKFVFKTLKNFGFGKSSLEGIMHEEMRNFSEKLIKDSKNGPMNL